MVYRSHRLESCTTFILQRCHEITSIIWLKLRLDTAQLCLLDLFVIMAIAGLDLPNIEELELASFDVPTQLVQSLTEAVHSSGTIPIQSAPAATPATVHDADVGAAPALALMVAAPAPASMAQLRTMTDAVSCARLLPSVLLRPYSVLGMQVSTGGSVSQTGPKPDVNTAIVDPAGMDYVQSKGPRGAGGASAAIYLWLGIDAAAGFPEAVKSKIKDSRGDY